MRLRQHLESAREVLAGLPSGALEAEILLAHAIDARRSFLYANPEMELPPGLNERFLGLVNRRLNGEPIAYITGKREFWSLVLEITPDVLIPRHETELLVEKALELIPASGACKVADLGTGSGAVALAIASERPDAEVHASEISPPAARLAGHNADRLQLQNVTVHTGSWMEPLPGRFSVVVSNPPYVALDDPHMSTGDCRFEPGVALSPGHDPLLAIRDICMQVRNRLEAGGHLLVEHGANQGEAVRRLFRAAGLELVTTHHDLAGHDRVTAGRMAGD